MENATLKDLLEKIEEGIEFSSPNYNSGYNSGISDYYSCPYCNTSERIRDVDDNFNISQMDHDDNCLYKTINELSNVLSNEDILNKTDKIIIDKDLYEEQIMYGDRIEELENE